MVGDKKHRNLGPRLSVVFAYYANPKMFRYQLEQFSAMDLDVLSQIEILVVDDASPNWPAANEAAGFRQLPLKVFRVREDKPWNQDAARNIGAFEARGSKLLLTDIDHVIPEDTIRMLLDQQIINQVHTLARKAHFSVKVTKSHSNSYFMSRQKYWEIGGYDEDFWGAYGSDVLFRRRIQKNCRIVELPHVRLEVATKGSISDAKNLNLSRKPSIWRRARGVLLRGLKLLRLLPSPRVLQNPYDRVL